MANQPKKYKKFVATAATATLVASAIVPVASAAEFKDVAGNTHAEAINALADQGIINGYSDGTFKPNQTINRGQVVKLLGRWLEAQGQEIPADWKTEQRFKDLPVTAEEELVKYAALAKDAGVFAGSNGNLNYTDSMQRQQMAVVLVRAINEITGVDLIAAYKDADFDSAISDLNKAYSAEQREAIVALEYAEITQVSSFKPGDSVTRGQFASFLYRTMDMELEVVADASVKAINNTTVEVTFDEEVADVKALDFAIEGLEISNAVVKQTNKKVVVLTTSAQTADVEYTVTLGEEKIGSFKGLSAVVPTKVELVSSSVQGKFGQQVSVQAKVTVADGQSKAGIPVTFSIPGNNNDAVTPTVVGEAVTNAEGVATYTYTRYGVTTDTVTAYATGDRSKFAIGYVFWGVDTILAITEVTEGATINNGANKTYKITYKDPETGKPVANKQFNVGFLDNMNVTAEKVANATVNGVEARQLSNGSSEKAAQISTDSKGEATFTVSGVNAAVTPVVFALNDNRNNNESTLRYKASALQASAAKVTFGAVQADYKIELKRDGGEVAAIGYDNGRKYNVVVKNKDGKPAANEIVNVAFNENLDRVISTNTTAEFIKIDDEDNKVGYNGKTITVKTNSKGEASFYIGSNKVDDYATPVAWIDINTSNAKEGNLDEGEPSTVAEISYFQSEYVDGASIRVADEADKKKTAFDGEGPAVFSVNLTNQSGEKYAPKAGEGIRTVSYTVFNEGANEVRLYEGNKEVVISPNRSYTLTNYGTGDLKVYSVNGKTTAVRVVATGVARYNDVDANNVLKDFNFSTKDAKATFTAVDEITNPYTGVIDLESIDETKKSFKFVGKKAIKYAGESDKTYKYFGIGSTPIASANDFIKVLNTYKAENKVITVTYEEKDGVVSFYIIKEGSGNTTDVLAKLNAASTEAQVKAALANYAAFQSLLDADKDTAVTAIHTHLKNVGTYTAASLAAYFDGLRSRTFTSVYTVSTGAVAGTVASADSATANFNVSAKTVGAELNGLDIVILDTDNNQELTTKFVPATGGVKAKVVVDLANVSSLDSTPKTTYAELKEAIEKVADVKLAVKLADNFDATTVVTTETLTLANGTATTAVAPAKLVITASHNVTLGSSVVLDIAGTEVTATTAKVEGNKVTLTFAADLPVAPGTVTVKSGITIAGYTTPTGGYTFTY